MYQKSGTSGLLKSKAEGENGGTFRRSSFFTALILSLETAPSGQFNRDPPLKYFSTLRLQIYRYKIALKGDIETSFTNFRCIQK